MNNEKGQSVVEFCLVILLFLPIIVSMIYGGFVYADYLQYSTAVREAARDIAIQDKDKREALINGLNNNAAGTIGNYVNPLTHDLYDAQFSASIRDEDMSADGDSENRKKIQLITVSVLLTLNGDQDKKNFAILPDRLGPLQCTMPIEQELDDDAD